MMYMTDTAIKNKEISTKKEVEQMKDATTRRGQDKDYRAKMVGNVLGKGGVPGAANTIAGIGKMIAGVVNDYQWYDNLGEGNENVTKPNLYYDMGIIDEVADRGLVNGTVASAHFIPTVGKQREFLNNSDINIGFVKYQTALQTANGRISDYEAGDLGQVTLSTIELFSLMHAIKRGICTANIQKDKYSGLRERLLLAEGWDPKDTIDHIKDYRARYNVLLAKINGVMFLPKDMTLWHRRKLLNSVILIDRSKGSLSFVVPVQLIYGRYSEERAAIEYNDNFNIVRLGDPHFKQTLDTALNYAEYLIGFLTYSKILKDMYGDINDTNLPMEVIEPVDRTMLPALSEDATICDQIRNATVFPKYDLYVDDQGAFFEAKWFDIRQNEDGLLYQGFTRVQPGTTSTPVIIHEYTAGSTHMELHSNISGDEAPVVPLYICRQGTGYSSCRNWIDYMSEHKFTLDVDDSNFTQQGVMEATRFSAIIKGYYAEGFVGDSSQDILIPVLSSNSTEVMVDYFSVGVMTGLYTPSVRIEGHWTTGSIGSTLAEAYNEANNMLRCFGYHPVQRKYESESSYYFCDVHNLISLPQENLAILHGLATKSLFNVVRSAREVAFKRR